DEDDAPEAALRHLARHELAEVERPVEIDRERLAPALVRDVPDGLLSPRAEARAADEDVDGTGALPGLLHDGRAALCRGGRRGDEVASDLLCDGGDLVARSRGHRHARARARESNSRRAADSATAARHERHAGAAHAACQGRSTYLRPRCSRIAANAPSMPSSPTSPLTSRATGTSPLVISAR